jgi:Ni/Co efflux regulator RcnB
MSDKSPSPTMSAWRRLAIALGAVAALGVADVTLAQPPHHGGYGGAPRGYGGPPRGYAGPPRGGPQRAPQGWGGGPAPRGGPPAMRNAPAARGWTGLGPGGAVEPMGWDHSRYNGYFVGGRWYPGQPPDGVTSAPGFRPGFVPWRRGAYLPPNYQSFVVTDWGRYHLRRPPAGYNWVQVGSEYLLISAATGLIFDVVN